MENTSIKSLQLPNIDISEDVLTNVTIIESIDFISKEENEEIIERIKQSLRDLKNPERWMTWEESNKILTEKYFGENV